MFSRATLQETASVAFRVAQPVAVLGCLSLLGFAYYGSCLNGKAAELAASSQYGMANVTLDRSGCILAIDTVSVAPLEVRAGTYETDPILDEFEGWNQPTPGGPVSWHLAGLSLYSAGSLRIMTVRYWVVSAVASFALLLLVTCRPLFRWLKGLCASE